LPEQPEARQRKAPKQRPVINTEAQVAKAQPDGTKARWYKIKGKAGLYLVVDPPGKRHPIGLKRWMHRYRRPDGRPNEIGIGHWPEVKLDQARAAWHDHRFFLKHKNEDPQSRRQLSRDQQVTVGECIDKYIERHSATKGESWKRNTKLLLHVHCASLAREAVGTISHKQVYKALLPLAIKTPKTARRVLDKLAEIFDFAIAQGLRVFANPATWKGLQKHNFPELSGLKREHHPALHYSKMPEFVRRLRQHQDHGVGAVALEIMILTVPRPNKELILAQWPEIDFEQKIWNIPAERMKARKPHRVPLSNRAMELFRRRKEQSNGSPYIFTGYSKEALAERTMIRLLRDTMRISKDEADIHGFRTTFRSWAADQKFDYAAVELCLAHTIGKPATWAYWDTDMLDERRKIMDAWASYCEGQVPNLNDP
jgi:integrase